ncbi:transposase [Rhizobium leguminosarum]|uniref:transposase n=1 Tax=Rhizobium leguminosarum TaxID=384 RepID=UPI001C8FF7D7|nr:transposase [Rhizobium leguminosarum]MBY2919473.1 IS110 family transposase [Rhizobium leguminosarum]MBY2975080.1 IS110 family transposase [Rhizobium leguminosarum]MBY2981813.1 IS110 family transposase [Rhizobium leguminosarum]MBY3011028.1 IS110 family transposase [Rhizobium leguminosarum]
MKLIERQMLAIEKEIMLIIRDDPDLAARFDIIVSIPGVSAVTAFALVIDMPELGTLDQRQAALLTGLDPSHGSPGHGPAVPSGRSDIRS